MASGRGRGGRFGGPGSRAWRRIHVSPIWRLSRRGRATLLVLLGLTLAVLAHASRGLLVADSGTAQPSGLAQESAERATAAPGMVSASPASIAPQLSDAMLSERILGRLPVSVREYRALLAANEGLDPVSSTRLVEQIGGDGGRGSLRVEYSFDAELTRRILKVLERGRVEQGHVIVLDPSSGRVLAYVSTDREGFPPDRSYPAASLIKVVTAAAALHYSPERAREPCLYRGNPYRLTRARLQPPSSGNSASLERALATSNNQCFAQLAVSAVGGEALLAAIQSFGLLDEPAPGHPAGSVDRGDGDYGLGRLGCGLDGCRITPLHAAQLAATLATGQRVTPWWIERIVDENGRALPLPRRMPARRVMSEALTEELRNMLVKTTTRGTARSGFRDRRGRPKLGAIQVAGKTGNLSGEEPHGRYEWFIGAAPAEAPTIAVAVLQLQGHLWWSKSSQVAADVLVQVFCDHGRCEPDLAARYTVGRENTRAAVLLSESPAP